MKKRNPTILLLIVSFELLILIGCKQDGPIIPDNPLNGRTTAIFNPELEYGTVTDIEGNIYKTIQIGTQTWMAENLRTTTYRNGEGIPTTFSNDLWGTAGSQDLFSNYNNTEDMDTIATYGRLYNWYAVDYSNGLAPEGWRVPTVNDWLTLIDFLGGDSIASNKLKEVGLSHWGYDIGSDNSSGFTALPNGRRYLSNDFSGMSIYSTFWTSSEYSGDKAGFLFLYYGDAKVWEGVNFKNNGYAVRCVKN